MAAGKKSVLLVNELGTGFGHATNLLAIGRALADLGYQVTCAMADLVHPAVLLRQAGFAVLQAPTWPSVGHGETGCYADILALIGFENAPALTLMTAGWQDLIGLVKPDLIVADHSPTAALAAFGVNPVVMLGNGFTLPPDNLGEYPMLAPDAAPLVPQSRLLEVIHEVQGNRQRPAPETLPGLLSAAFRGVLSLPELDVYADIRAEETLPPLADLPVYTPRRAAGSVYAYLTDYHRELRTIADALVEVDADVACYVSGHADIAGVLERGGVELLDEPADLTVILPQVSVVVSHASMGMAHAGLVAGRPQLVLPHDLEKECTARALDALGVCVSLHSAFDSDDIVQSIEQLLGPGSHEDHAAVCAQAVLAREPVDALAVIVEACVELMG